MIKLSHRQINKYVRQLFDNLEDMTIEDLKRDFEGRRCLLRSLFWHAGRIENAPKAEHLRTRLELLDFKATARLEELENSDRALYS